MGSIVRIWLKIIRKHLGLTTPEAANKSGISPQYYNFIENGKRSPSTKVAKRIGAAMGFDWTRFYPDQEE